MSGTQDTSSRLPLLALAMASFGIGTTEFVIMGLLPDVASDLQVTIPQAGLLVTGYALSVTFGSPFLAVATANMNRRHTLFLLMAVFIFGNLLCALAPNYGLLMGARIVTALCHGAFFGIGSVVAASLVPPKKQAQAIAMMFAGLTLANVLGVPFGTALGEALGWRKTFFAVVVIGLIAASALWFWLPKRIPTPQVNVMQELRSLKSLQVMLVMLISVLAATSLFSVFTYIAPILDKVTKLSPHVITFMLLIFGVGLTVGNFIGGRLGDWKLMPSVIGCFALIAIVLGVFTQSVFAAIPAGGHDLHLGCARLRACFALADACRQGGLGGAEPRLYAQSGCVQLRQCDGRLGWWPRADLRHALRRFALDRPRAGALCLVFQPDLLLAGVPGARHAPAGPGKLISSLRAALRALD